MPGDFPTIQAALNAAAAGDTINVLSGTYFEKLSFPHGGSAGGGYITLQAGSGQSPILDGTGVSGSNMVLIDTQSYVKLIGFEIRNNLKVNDGSGVRILGSGSNIEIRNNRIHDIRGRSAMGITVYGTAPTPISNLIIDGNQIYDCEPANSETLTLNGNVTDFQVTNNLVRDVNNIGIVFIGGERDIQPDPTKVARNGECRGNQVYHANSNYGGLRSRKPEPGKWRPRKPASTAVSQKSQSSKPRRMSSENRSPASNTRRRTRLPASQIFCIAWVRTVYGPE